MGRQLHNKELTLRLILDVECGIVAKTIAAIVILKVVEYAVEVGMFVLPFYDRMRDDPTVVEGDAAGQEVDYTAVIEHFAGLRFVNFRDVTFH